MSSPPRTTSTGSKDSDGRQQSNNSPSRLRPPPIPPPPHPPLTGQDLDVEDAESSVFEAVEKKHRRGGSTASSLAGGAGRGRERDVNEKVLFRALSRGSSGASRRSSHTSATQKSNKKLRSHQKAEKVKRLNRAKAVAAFRNKKHGAASARNLLLDIQEEDETEAMLNTQNASHLGESDGLMKVEQKENPYAAAFDHYVLKADSTSSDDEAADQLAEMPDLNRRGSHSISLPQMPGHHRSLSVPIDFNNVNTTSAPQLGDPGLSLPLHGPPGLHRHASHGHVDSNQLPQFHRQTSADGYTRTDNEGFMGNIPVNVVNPSFTSHENGQQPFGANNNNMNTGTCKQATEGCTDDAYHSYYSSCTDPPKCKKFFPRWMREIGAMFTPYRLAVNCHDIVVRSYFLWFGFPCLLASALFYYVLENPVITFLPGQAPIAWWLLFVTRQTVTLGLARMTVFIFVDGFMLGTRLAVQTFGPLLTLIAATGKGWPLILASWGVWNFILIHGSSQFQHNWLYFTQMGLFNQRNNGSIVNSTWYTRILLCAILGGLAVSAKRTLMAMKFGSKQFAEFKPRLERILADVVLLSEIATLAEQADEAEEEAEEVKSEHSWDISGIAKKSKRNLKEYLWDTNTEIPPESDDEEHSNEDEDDSVLSLDGEQNNSIASDSEPDSPNSPERPVIDRGGRPSLARSGGLSRQLTKSESGRLQIKDLLDSWSEPDSKSDKSTDNINIHDILKFRRALAHLDEENLFGDAFGCTNTRDQCIASSHTVYFRLLKLAPTVATSISSSMDEGDCTVLPFEVLALLTLQDDGVTQNVAKKRMIRRVFTPDRSGGLPLLAFVQACDKIYKRLRYFRASLRNARVIDDVLERLINGVFYFVLILTLSSIMQFNPWTLMMSITSLMVSVSFALGSSISKYVEGVLLIAIRRPYDLGDRIFMSGAEGINPYPDVTKNSWFVEDITLTTTTLRYAYTNEVATINNWSIAGSRIVNCARSPHATVHFEFASHTSILEGGKVEKFRAEIKKYVEERPRVWESISYVRMDKFDKDKERIDFSLAIRHRSSWQESGRIKIDRSELFRFLFELGNKLDVHFDEPVGKQVIYQGGDLKRGDTEGRYMRDLLMGANMMKKDL